MSSKPNIIIIMTDQQRADLCRREGYPLDTTPFLDSLVTQGQWFNHAYTAAPVCAPARISMLTGRFPSAHRVKINPNIDAAVYLEDLVDVLSFQGYTTAMIGKNHSHLTPERVDHWFALGHDGGSGDARTGAEKGFDQWLKDLTQRIGLEPTPFPVECQGPYRAVSDAISWLQRIGEKPFFLWLSFPEPHNPYQVPEPYFSMFPMEKLPPVRASRDFLKEKDFKWIWMKQLGEYACPQYDELVDRARANYHGMLRLIDDQIRRLVEYLEVQSIWENTLLIFLSDHGDFVGEYGLIRKGLEMPEVLMRIPMAFVGPGVREDSCPNTAHVSIIDVMPTICEMLGVPIPYGVQGRSLWPILTGQEYPKEEFEDIYAEQGFGGLHYAEGDSISFEDCLIHRPNGPTFDELNLCSQSGTMRMLRRGNWKLVMDMQGEGQLYNLKQDPGEIHNLYGDPKYKDIQNELSWRLLVWMLRMQDPLPVLSGRYRMKVDSRNYWTPYQKK